jgi:hypothetical protein
VSTRSDPAAHSGCRGEPRYSAREGRQRIENTVLQCVVRAAEYPDLSRPEPSRVGSQGSDASGWHPFGVSRWLAGVDATGVLPQLFVRLSVVEQDRDLSNKSIADRKDTRYPSDGSEYVRGKTVDAEKHRAGNQADPYSQCDRATSAYSPKLLAGGRLHGRQDIPATSAAPYYRPPATYDHCDERERALFGRRNRGRVGRLRWLRREGREDVPERADRHPDRDPVRCDLKRPKGRDGSRR